MIKELNFDHLHLVVHADGDPGDCFADTFRYLYATKLNGRLDIETLAAAKRHLFPIRGIGWRHPDKWNDPCDLSRDQQSPAVICLEATGDYQLVIDLRNRHKERGWRYQNLDWASAEHKNYYAPKQRTTEGDIQLFFNSLIRVVDSYVWPEGSVARDQNHGMALLQVSVAGHSFWSNAARWVWKTFRRKGILWALHHYYRVDNPGIAKEFDPLYKAHILERNSSSLPENL